MDREKFRAMKGGKGFGDGPHESLLLHFGLGYLALPTPLIHNRPMMFKILKRLRQFLLMTFMLVDVLACASARSNILPQPLTSPLPARPGTRTVQEDWLLGLPTVGLGPSSLEWLDATHVVYSISSKEDPNATHIELLNVVSLERTPIGNGSNPKPSPDGKLIAFFQTTGAQTELWVMQANGKQRKRVGELKGDVSFRWTTDFAWSPDSKSLAVNHRTDVNYWERDVKASEDQSKTSAVDAEHLTTAEPLTQIDIIDIHSLKSRRIATVDASIVADLSWFPNGQELLFMTQRVGYYYPDKAFRAEVQRLSINDGQVRAVATFDGLQQYLRPAASPDGRKIAFMYDAENPDYSYLLSIGLAATGNSAETSQIQQLTHEIKLKLPSWSSDAKKIYALREFGAYQQIYSIDAKTGAATQVTSAPMNVKNYALSRDGSQLAWVAEDAHANVVMQLADSNGNNMRTLTALTEVASDIALSEVREIEWESDYPVSMRGLLVLPLNYRQGTQYPLIVDIHGGGAGATIYLVGGILVSTPLEWQLWAAKGYAVFVPEFRSSGSFGSLAITRDDRLEHDLINRDVHDIVAGVDALISRGIVDRDRTAVIGQSAGGRRANWLAVATHQFRAVVSKDGWADDWLMAGVQGLERDYKNFGGSPSQKPGNYQKNSPIFHSIGASTPTLFLMGNPKLGGIDRYDTVRWLYNAIKEQGVATQYIQYPDEGHNFARPANRKDALERTAKWIEKHFAH